LTAAEARSFTYTYLSVFDDILACSERAALPVSRSVDICPAALISLSEQITRGAALNKAGTSSGANGMRTLSRGLDVFDTLKIFEFPDAP
jgi:hypothetical protein